MKVAVAAALLAPLVSQAGVYGRTDGVVRYMDDGTSDYWDVGVDKFRWGIVGSEDLGNGMKAHYHMEWAHDNGEVGGSTQKAPDYEASRLAYVGLSGDWGKMTIGRNWWPSYFAVWGATDWGDAHAIGTSNFSGNRSGDMIRYDSPDMSGFTANVAMVVSGESGASNEDAVDVWEIVGQYKNGPIQLGATYRNDQRDTATCGAGCRDVDIWGIAGQYKMDNFTVVGKYGNSDPGSGGSETDVWALGLEANFDNNTVHVAYRNSDTDGGANVDDWEVGVRHFLSKETRIFAEYRNVDDDSKADEVDMFAVGIRKDWKL
jgi:predicted porin